MGYEMLAQYTGKMVEIEVNYNQKRRTLIMKAIIFDMDGVVLKTCDEQGNYLWERTLADDLGLSKNHVVQIFSSKEWKKSVLSGKREPISYLENTFNEPSFACLGISAELFLHYWITKDCSVNHDMMRLIDSLEVPTYMGTNQEAHRTKALVQLVGKHFKGCFASYQIGAVKPEQFFYRHIEQALGLNPSDLLLVDDTLSHVEGAQRCGWQAYHYQDDLENLRIFIDNMV